MVFTASKLLLLVSVICIVLHAFGVNVGPADLFEIGVAFGFSSFLVP